MPSDLTARNTKRSRINISKLNKSVDNRNLLKPTNKAKDTMESSRYFGKPWQDVNDTDSSWFALKKDRDYVHSKRLDHLSKA